MGGIFRWLVLAGGCYAIVCALLFFLQRRMLYHPERRPEPEMLEKAGGAGIVRWNDPNGVAIGWMTPGGAGAVPILILQGNAGNALHRIFLIEKLRAAGISAKIFILDYPGYGSRPGSPTQSSLTAAAVAGIELLPSPAVVLGESLGSGVAAQVVARSPKHVRGVILVTPFHSMTEVAAHHHPWLPVRWLLMDSYDSMAALRDFSGPVAVIIAEQDQITPPRCGRQLLEKLRGSGRLWSVPDADHNEAAWNLSDARWREVWAFVSTENHSSDPERKLP